MKVWRIEVHVSEEAHRRLQLIQTETGRGREDLATSAVEEAALEYFRHRKDDPAKGDAA